MSSTQPEAGGTGDYPDSDLGDVEAGEGTYTDQETSAEKRGEDRDVRGPDDRGEYTDSAHVNEHRPEPATGGYTRTDRTNDRPDFDEAGENRHG